MKKTKYMLGVMAMVMAFLFAGKSQAASLPIYDTSEWQGAVTSAQAKKLKTEVGGWIIRTGYGSGYKDKVVDNNISMAEKYKIPYAVYQYGQYTSVSDAKAEAKSAYARAPHARFYVNDAEEVTTTSGSYSAATKAWGAEMQKLTSKPVYLYSYRYIYNSHIKTKANYDGFWLAAYQSYKPTPYDYQLWQYSSSHYSMALGKGVDASKQVAGNWFKTTVDKDTYPYGGRFAGETVRVAKGAKFYQTSKKIDTALTKKNLVIKQVKTIQSGKSNQAVLVYNGKVPVGWVLAQNVFAYYSSPKIKAVKVIAKGGINTYHQNGKLANHIKCGTKLKVSGIQHPKGTSANKFGHAGHKTYFSARKGLVKMVK